MIAEQLEVAEIVLQSLGLA